MILFGGKRQSVKNLQGINESMNQGVDGPVWWCPRGIHGVLCYSMFEVRYLCMID